MSTSLPQPRTKSALIRHARQAARLTRGRSRFVRRERVLPIGIPLGLAAGTLVYRRWRDEDADEGVALAVALGVGLGIVGITAGLARLEWDAGLAHFEEGIID